MFNIDTYFIDKNKIICKQCYQYTNKKYWCSIERKIFDKTTIFNKHPDHKFLFFCSVKCMKIFIGKIPLDDE